MQVKKEITYLEDIDAMVRFDGSVYVYQDMNGYKTYKTLSGIKRKITNERKVRGIA